MSFFIKRTYSIAICFLLFKTAYSQSLIVRPGLGVKFFNTKPDYSLPNNLDATFSGKQSFLNLAVNVSVELLFEKGSYEIAFTSQQIPTAASTEFKDAGISQSHVEDGGISQFQFVYNKFLERNADTSKNITPFLGIGFGLGFNRPSSFYDSSYYHSKFYSTNNPNEFIDYSQNYASLSKLSYSFVFKVGIRVKIKHVERMRIYGLYNLGLNKLVRSDIVYYHTQNKYYGSTTTKGSQFSLMLTAPIYLKKKKVRFS